MCAQKGEIGFNPLLDAPLQNLTPPSPKGIRLKGTIRYAYKTLTCIGSKD